MRIYWTFDEGLHPNSDSLTTLELAKILEEKYSIVEKWENDMIEPFMKFMSEEIQRYRRLSVPKLRQWLKNHWWRYGVREGLFGGAVSLKGAARKRSERSGKVAPFVDTGTYARSMSPEFEFDEKEKKALGFFLQFDAMPS